MKLIIDTQTVDEGAQAFRRGVSVGANPYQEKSVPALSWLIGYMSEYFFAYEGERYRSTMSGGKPN